MRLVPPIRRKRRAASVAALALAAAGLVPAAASAGVPAPPPTTEQQTITGDIEPDFSLLRSGPGWARVVREELGGGRTGRDARRRSLLYFTAMDELHYTDEESPARVEFLDFTDSPFTSAWFPFEAFRAHSIDQTIRTVNQFVPASPIRQGDGRRARMALALTTADSADNQQVNEVSGYVRLLEGGRIDPNSGVEPSQACPAGPIPPGEAARYTGVQDYDDYLENDAFYDPDRPLGRYAAWPRYPGLMDRAQQPFEAVGLRVPSYVTVGNHDRLQQGNQWVNGSFETVATGCAKAFAPFLEGQPTPEALASSPGQVGAVPPDPARASVQNPGFRDLHATGRQPDAHGFGYVDPAELAASAGAANYYAWSPRPGFRFVSISTVSEGGVTGRSDKGNLDDPQFRWLDGVLRQATANRELVVVFAHHPIGSLTADVPDEAAPPCTRPEDDPNPGCDLDPRSSTPIRLGDDVRDLLLANPSVIAYVGGHTTVNDITPFPRAEGGGFWQIESGSVSDWPAQARLLEVMDNRDGTLSLFGTMVNQAGSFEVPASGTAADAFTPETIASIARVIAFNDYQGDSLAGEGDTRDRNVELLLGDPFAAARGRSRLAAPRSCIRRSGRAYVRGRNVRTVRFSIDGRRLRTVRQPDAGGRFAVPLRARRIGAGRHRLAARVAYEPASASPAETLSAGVRVCRARLTPRFTG